MKTLGQLLEEIPKNRHARFIREFRGAVIAGELDAVEVSDRIKLPPAKKGGKGRETSDFAVTSDPETLTNWTQQTAAKMTSKTAIRNAPSLADLQAGKVDAKQAAQETRERLQQVRHKAARQAQRRKAKPADSDTPDQ